MLNQRPIKITPNSNATKLTEADYINIRNQYSEGLKGSILTRMYKIGPARLEKILNNPLYIHGGNSLPTLITSFNKEHQENMKRLKKLSYNHNSIK